MTPSNDTTRVFIPLTRRRRNGRPKILPPDPKSHLQSTSQDPHILRALEHAWAWRRQLESGEATTIEDIAKTEMMTDRYVSRIMRLAYLSPDLLERFMITREPPTVSVNELVDAACLPWMKQMEQVFERPLTETRLTGRGG